MTNSKRKQLIRRLERLVALDKATQQTRRELLGDQELIVSVYLETRSNKRFIISQLIDSKGKASTVKSMFYTSKYECYNRANEDNYNSCTKHSFEVDVFQYNEHNIC